MELPPKPPPALLLDIDGVLYVGDEPIEGAVEALAELRELASGLRLVTNTTSRPRRMIVEHLADLGFAVEADEIITPCATAVSYCDQKDLKNVKLLVGKELLEDLDAFGPLRDDAPVDAVVLGDLGEDFSPSVLNNAFRILFEGAELIALQHNRYWQHAEGLRLDVGAYAAALEYATGREATVIGKPSHEFYDAVLADLGVSAHDALMVGDDVEADISGALSAGLDAILVRTGKYRPSSISTTGFGPSAIIDSIADLPELLRSRA